MSLAVARGIFSGFGFQKPLPAVCVCSCLKGRGLTEEAGKMMEQCLLQQLNKVQNILMNLANIEIKFIIKSLLAELENGSDYDFMREREEFQELLRRYGGTFPQI